MKLPQGKSASDINGPTIIIPKWTYMEVAQVAAFHIHEVENTQEQKPMEVVTLIYGTNDLDI